MFATLDDVNMHLPTDKLEMTTPDLNLFGIDAERIIRGYLAGTVPPLILAGWADPTVAVGNAGYVPELIRAIAGRFIAAFYYKERYSEDSLEIPAYAQQKYDEAMAMLNGIISGALEFFDVDLGTENVQGLSSDDFTPNAKTKGPVFTMDDNFYTIPPVGQNPPRFG